MPRHGQLCGVRELCMHRYYVGYVLRHWQARLNVGTVRGAGALHRACLEARRRPERSPVTQALLAHEPP